MGVKGGLALVTLSMLLATLAYISKLSLSCFIPQVLGLAFLNHLINFIKKWYLSTVFAF